MGFFRPAPITDKPQLDKRSVFRELGLPYVADPAITRHLAEFLQSALDPENGVLSAILIQWRIFHPPQVFRDRVRDVVEHWFGRQPLIFEVEDLDLAVAISAASIPTRVRQAVELSFAVVCRARITQVCRMRIVSLTRCC